LAVAELNEEKMEKAASAAITDKAWILILHSNKKISEDKINIAAC
jgi:hypothetical protein